MHWKTAKRRGVLAALIIGLSGCGGAQSSGDDVVVEGERVYARYPTGWGSVAAESTLGPELIRCYEGAAATQRDDVTQVEIVLEWDGSHLRPRLVQRRTNLSGPFASCVEEVRIVHELEPEQGTTSEIIPVELGPLEP